MIENIDARADMNGAGILFFPISKVVSYPHRLQFRSHRVIRIQHQLDIHTHSFPQLEDTKYPLEKHLFGTLYAKSGISCMGERAVCVRLRVADLLCQYKFTEHIIICNIENVEYEYRIIDFDDGI